jgi:prolipoprotein diacylglyceryltransferase
MRFPRETEAYGAQLTHNLISPGAPLSLPAHPLAIYFAFASLLTLVVLLWLLRRGTPAGSMLAVFCILWPLAKLALEPLRAVPRPGMMMTIVPATILVFGCALAGAMLRRAALRRANRPRVHGAEVVSST